DAREYILRERAALKIRALFREYQLLMHFRIAHGEPRYPHARRQNFAARAAVDRCSARGITHGRAQVLTFEAKLAVRIVFDDRHTEVLADANDAFATVS